MRRFPGAWTDTLAKLGFRRKRKKVGRRDNYRRRRPQIEALEPRQMLSITVDTLVDEEFTTGNTIEQERLDGDGLSLREAIGYANESITADRIEFASSLTAGGAEEIDLDYGELTIADDVAIAGPGAGLLTIDAQDNSRVFKINSGVDAEISGVTITGGGGVTTGGGIHNAGDLTLDSVRVTDNETTTIGWVFGGGIYNLDGSLHIIDSTIDTNASR